MIPSAKKQRRRQNSLNRASLRDFKKRVKESLLVAGHRREARAVRLLVPDTLYNKSGVDALDKLSEKLNNKGYRVTPNRV